MDLQSAIRNEHKKRMKWGYLWAIFTALLWGLWYIPGSVVWVLNPFDKMYAEIAGTSGDSTALIVVAVLITALNALAGALVLLVWNGALGKLGELGRTFREIHPCTKWFFAASLFGGPIAILGSFIAMGFVGGAFAAVTALLYPVVGAVLANRWYGEKISTRTAIGILIIIMGGAVIYGGSIFGELGSNIPIIGLIGGIMIPLGWGIEGAIAGKGLDISEPDVALHMRFISETAIWWIIIIPVLAIAGFPMIEYTLQIFDPLLLVILSFTGITFGFCYVSWYKSFPLIGVAKGQGVANLYALVAVVSMYLFFGSTPSISLLIGGTLCIIGSTVMFTEEVTEEALR